MSAPVDSIGGGWTGPVAAAAILAVLVLGWLLDRWAAASRRRPVSRVYWFGRHGLADCLQRAAPRVTLLELPDGSTLEVRR